MRRIALLVMATVALSAVPASPAGAAYRRERIVSCGSGRPACWPAAFAFTPTDPLMFWAERKTGRIRRTNLTTGTTTTWKRIGQVARQGEKGVLGIAVDPMWPAERWVYVYYTRRDPTRNLIVRFRRRDDGSFARERLASIPARSYHNGGVIHFGPDGKLYAVTGDAGAPRRSQRRASLAGKVLRMNRGGGVPPDNPFDGKLAYSYGHRNSFGFAFDPLSGRLWQTENGPQCDDELNRILAGRNFGWGPASACPNTNDSGPAPVAPQVRWNPVIAPTGAAFCQTCGLTADDEGRLFVGSYVDRWLRRITLDADRKRVDSRKRVFRNRRGVLAVEAAPDGTLYFSDPRGIFRLEVAP